MYKEFRSYKHCTVQKTLLRIKLNRLMIRNTDIACIYKYHIVTQIWSNTVKKWFHIINGQNIHLPCSKQTKPKTQ